MFLYITGTIGWAGRSYLIAVRKGKDAAMSEIILNLPLALSCTVGAALWPLLAFKEFASGELLAKDTEITVSPR